LCDTHILKFANHQLFSSKGQTDQFPYQASISNEDSFPHSKLQISSKIVLAIFTALQLADNHKTFISSISSAPTTRLLTEMTSKALLNLHHLCISPFQLWRINIVMDMAFQ
jgi:hypothetical protein